MKKARKYRGLNQSFQKSGAVIGFISHTIYSAIMLQFSYPST